MQEPTFDEAEWDAAVSAVDAAGERITAGAPEVGRVLVVAAAERLRVAVGDEHPDYAQAVAVEGDALAALGRMGEAEARYRAALAIHDLYGEGDEAEIVRPYRVSVLGRLGYLEALTGRYADAEAHLCEALTEATLVHGEGAVELADQHNSLGVCWRFAGRYDEALAAYERAGALRTKAGLEQPPGHFHNLSGLATARGDFIAAERWAQQAVAARRAGEGEGFAHATDLCGWGDALAGQERHGEAEAAYRQALALYAASGSADHPEVAFALHNLADALAEQGRSAEAEAAYREAIARKEATLGPDSHEVAATLNNLAALLGDAGRRDEARQTATRAVTIVKLVLAPDHPVRVACESMARTLGAS